MNKNDFDNLVESIKQAGKIKKDQMKASRITEYKTPNIKAIRRNLRVTQIEFAHMIGVSVGTLRNWEQGRREPEGPAKALLRIAAVKPKAVAEALHS
jgi:putative transcriptional regulator